MHDVLFGRWNWPLPPFARPVEDSAMRAAAFAAALLEGKVLAAMADLKPVLAAPPASAARPESQAQKRVVELVARLRKSKYVVAS